MEHKFSYFFFLLGKHFHTKLCCERTIDLHKAAHFCVMKNGHYLCTNSIYSRKAVINLLLQLDHLMVYKNTIGDIIK